MKLPRLLQLAALALFAVVQAAPLSLKADEKPASTTAVMKLTAIHGQGAGQVADVSGNTTMTGLTPPLPPQFITKVASFQAELEGKIPATRHGQRTETLAGTIHLVSEAPGPNGATMSVTIDSVTKNATRLTFP